MRGGCILAACLALGACGEGDETCADCRDEKCLDLLELCNTDDDCACMAACLGDDGLPAADQCLDGCGLEQRPAGYGALELCVATGCPDDDECSAPADFVAMDDQATGDRAGMCEPSAAIGDADAGTGDSIGSGGMADCGFDMGLTFDPVGETLQLQSEDGRVCVRVERRNDGGGSLQNTQFTLLSLTVGPLGEVAHIDDAMCWYSSHHNFNDWAHASTATRHYDLSVTLDDHGGNRTWTLHTFQGDDVDPAECAESTAAAATGICAIGDPVALQPVNP